MSEREGEGAEDAPSGRGEIWIEKYRPDGLGGVVGHEDIVERLERYVAEDDLPHLMFAGPAGTGKCVTGETPVLTSRGVERIETAVGDCEGYGDPDEGLEVLSFESDGEFRFVAPEGVFSKEADHVVDVETRDGGDFTATPEHPLLILGEEGFDWKAAGDIEEGDRLARPVEAPMPDTDTRLEWVDRMDGERTFVTVTEAFAERYDIPVEEAHVAGKKAVIEGVRAGDPSEKIAAEGELTRSTVEDYRRQLDDVDLQTTSTTCSLSFLRTLDVARDQLREHVVEIQHVTRYNQRAQPITPPWSVTPELSAFVGLAISEARIDGGRIQFYNTDDRLLAQFERAATELFGVDVRHGENKGVPYREINSATLSRFLRTCFDVFDGATGGEGIGSTLVTADEASRRAFLRAVFDAEAYVDERGAIELTQKNEQLVTLVAYLLAGFGIPSRRKTERKAATNGSGTKRTYHSLHVSGATVLSRFEEAVGFSLPSKAERLAAGTDKHANPNQDTVPTQGALDTLCDELYLPKQELTTETLNPESPGRENYLEDVEAVVEAATAKVETAQEVLEQLDHIAVEADVVTSVPASWAGEREALEPLTERTAVADSTGVQTDRLLEYADGRRTPTADRVGSLLVELDAVDDRPPVATVQTVLQESIERLEVPYNHVAEGTDLLGTDVINLLENDDHDLRTLGRFGTVVERIREVATGMLSRGVLEALQTLDTLASGSLYFDEVESVLPREETRRVYDLTVPGTHNYVAGNVPTVMHNTASSQAIAKELYGDDWQSFFLELNASDQRGIDVIRDQVKSFARTQMASGQNYRIIFLDEADALTSEAQSALRRTMEQFSSNTRFILSCNYSSQIIDPIQSRCTVFRFSPLSDDAVEARIREIAETEDVEVTDDGVDALVYAADGDMRAAINALQATSGMRDVVDEDAVFAMTSTARPEEVHEMVQTALDGDFTAARARLDELLTEKGMAGGDVIDQLHRGVWEFELEDERAVRLLDRVGEADYRITEGANERIQLEALLASLALER